MLNKVLGIENSKINGKIEVTRLLGSGVVVKVNGLTQSGGVVDLIWKQTLRKVKNKNTIIKRCLILGLGGGSAARWVKKYWLKAEITGIELDPVMIEFGNKYLHLEKTNTNIVITDAYNWLKDYGRKKKERFDLVIVDLYKGDEVPNQFNDIKFAQLVKKVLDRRALVIFNRLYFGDSRSQALKFGSILESEFSKVDYFYPEANLMLICEK